MSVCSDSLRNCRPKHFSFSEDFSQISSQMYTSSSKVPSFLPDCNRRSLFFSADFLKNPKISNFIKICPAGAKCSMWTDRQTEMMKLQVAFRNFPKGSKIINDKHFSSLAYRQRRYTIRPDISQTR